MASRAIHEKFNWGFSPGVKKTWHLLIKPCIVAIATRNLFLPLASKNFMPAVV
jgi:hypothetical protein